MFSKKKIIYFYMLNSFVKSDMKKKLEVINQQMDKNKAGIFHNMKSFIWEDILKGAWYKIKGNFVKIEEKEDIGSLFSNVGSLEDSLLSFTSKKKSYLRKSLWGEAIESGLSEAMFKIFYDIFNDFLDSFGLNIDRNEIAKEINEKNLIKKNLILSDEEKKSFGEIINLLNLSTKRINTNSVIYINGLAGIGKTTNIINELGKEKFTIFYINSSNILYGKYNSNNISDILSGIWKRALDLKNKGKKVVIIFDECESLMKKRNKKKVEGTSVEDTIINSRRDLEQALTVFFLYILAQRQVSVVLISNPCYDEDGNLDISEEMNRRINYVYDMELPSLKNLIKLWRFYLVSYKIQITDENLENVIYYLSEISHKNKISIRAISSVTSALRGRSIKLIELINLVK